MTSDSDPELLRRYLAGGPAAQEAFATLVARHLDLVYSVALRTVRSPQLAEEVAQSAFVDLARRARSLSPGTPLVAWLHVVSRRTAIDTVRHDARRRARETAAAHLQDAPAMPAPPDWSAIEPLLDEAVESLPPADRAAILLRFFENKSLREIGAALGATDDAAQKRVTRALDRLRAFFLKRGLALSSTSLATTLSAHGLVSAPAALGPAISHAALQLAPAAVSGTGILAMTALQKIGLTSLALLTVVAVYEGASLYSAQRQLDLARAEAASAAADLRRLRATQASARPAPAAAAPLTITAVDPADANLEEQIKVWFAQIDRLKSFQKERARLDIPEFALLKEEDWIQVAIEAPLTKDTDLRRASGKLRDRAISAVHSRLSRALSDYTRANGDHLPASVAELTPLISPPLEPEVLAGYDILHQGKASDLSANDKRRLILRREFPDIEYDTYSWAGINTHGNNGNALTYVASQAQTALKRSQPDAPVNAVQLQPYLKFPVDVVTLQRFLDDRPSRHAP
ncbi:MAG TPA: sigma-70 family RNA polymerase sigma factor [Opitutaceae bacterium]